MSDLEKAQKVFKEGIEAMQQAHNQLVAQCPYETRLAVAAWVIRAIVQHANEGGTFRHLIYGRLGFDMDAYVPLYIAGGMTISNEFVITRADEKDAELAERLMDSMKPGGEPVKLEVGKEPWTTICDAGFRLNDLSQALAAEQEKRKRLERELEQAKEDLEDQKGM